MGTPQDLQAMFLAMMKAMKQQEADEDREREQVNRVSKCLHSILS